NCSPSRTCSRPSRARAPSCATAPSASRSVASRASPRRSRPPVAASAPRCSGSRRSRSRRSSSTGCACPRPRPSSSCVCASSTGCRSSCRPRCCRRDSRLRSTPTRSSSARSTSCCRSSTTSASNAPTRRSRPRASTPNPPACWAARTASRPCSPPASPSARRASPSSTTAPSRRATPSSCRPSATPTRRGSRCCSRATPKPSPTAPSPSCAAVAETRKRKNIMPSTQTTPPVLSTRALSKDYGPVRVVSDISLAFHAGSIHALLGENGAGKSTLIKMLSGQISPSEGEVLVDGEARQLRSVRDGQQLGIIALPQELTLVPTLGAAENIFLGIRRPGSRGLVDRRKLDAAAAAELERLGQRIPLDVPVGELSAVQQTMIAIARALARDARVLILDEPTAALTDTETEQLFTVLRALRDAGTGIVYVSHRLEEVFALADTATVMRNGRHVWTKAISETDTDDVVSAMIGREHGQVYPPRAGAEGDVILEVENLEGYTLRGVSLTARSGRVLGIAGLAGSGRSELLKIVAGAQRARAGVVRLAGSDVTRHSLARAMDAGIAFVPEERRSQ